jgi:hypothetical protein
MGRVGSHARGASSVWLGASAGWDPGHHAVAANKIHEALDVIDNDRIDVDRSPAMVTLDGLLDERETAGVKMTLMPHRIGPSTSSRQRRDTNTTGQPAAPAYRRHLAEVGMEAAS